MFSNLICSCIGKSNLLDTDRQINVKRQYSSVVTAHIAIEAGSLCPPKTQRFPMLWILHLLSMEIISAPGAETPEDMSSHWFPSFWQKSRIASVSCLARHHIVGEYVKSPMDYFLAARVWLGHSRLIEYHLQWAWTNGSVLAQICYLPVDAHLGFRLSD